MTKPSLRPISPHCSNLAQLCPAKIREGGVKYVKVELSYLPPLSRHLASGCGSVIWTGDLGVSREGRRRPGAIPSLYRAALKGSSRAV